MKFMIACSVKIKNTPDHMYVKEKDSDSDSDLWRIFDDG